MKTAWSLGIGVVGVGLGFGFSQLLPDSPPSPSLPFSDVQEMAKRLYGLSDQGYPWHTYIKVTGDGKVEVEITLPTGNTLNATGQTMEEVAKVFEGEGKTVARVLVGGGDGGSGK